MLRERQQQNEQPLRMPSKERPFLWMMSMVEERAQLIDILVPMRDVIPRVSNQMRYCSTSVPSL